MHPGISKNLLKYLSAMCPKYNSTKKQTTAPLMCWDIYSAYLARLQNQLTDASHLNKILEGTTFTGKNNLLDNLKSHDAVVLTGTNRKILWVSAGFSEMTGYDRSEVLGKKPALLQGKNTSPESVSRIRTSLDAGEPVSGRLINYKRNGTEYLCEISIEPVRTLGRLTHFLAFEKRVPMSA
jgi:PAS domain S-box-containing protein